MFDCFIRKTCPCNEYPLKPYVYIEKLGFAGVYLFFLFLLQNIDCGYSLEPPRRVFVMPIGLPSRGRSKTSDAYYRSCFFLISTGTVLINDFC